MNEKKKSPLELIWNGFWTRIGGGCALGLLGLFLACFLLPARLLENIQRLASENVEIKKGILTLAGFVFLLILVLLGMCCMRLYRKPLRLFGVNWDDMDNPICPEHKRHMSSLPESGYLRCPSCNVPHKLEESGRWVSLEDAIKDVRKLRASRRGFTALFFRRIR